MSETRIECNDLGHVYPNGVEAVKNVNVSISQGEVISVVGQNGSGKSTILRLLTGLLDKDAGSAYIKGKEISNRSEETKMVTGYMSQIIDLDSEMNIYENLSI